MQRRPSRLFQHPLVAGLVFEDGHDPAPAVDADALAVLDPLRRLAGADHRRQVVLACDDGHVAHRSADVGDRRADALEDRTPGRVGDLADEDVALLDAADFTTRAGPSTTPEQAAKPLSSFESSSPSLSQESRFSRVMPHSISIDGSSITSGTAPSAGEVGCLLHSAMAALRSATTAGQCFGPRASAPLPQASIRSMIALSTSYWVR